MSIWIIFGWFVGTGTIHHCFNWFGIGFQSIRLSSIFDHFTFAHMRNFSVIFFIQLFTSIFAYWLHFTFTTNIRDSSPNLSQITILFELKSFFSRSHGASIDTDQLQFSLLFSLNVFFFVFPILLFSSSYVRVFDWKLLFRVLLSGWFRFLLM